MNLINGIIKPSFITMFKRALLLCISHYMLRLLIKPSSGVSKHRMLKVAVTDPLLKLIKLIIHIADGHYENQYRINI
jgi:hypothetical protein